MKRRWFTFALTTIAATALMTSDIVRGQESTSSSEGQQFGVTVTNLTRGQTFTPVLVASHRKGVHLFTLGSAASPELATLAEEGNVGPLTNLLLASPEVFDVTNSGPPPGGFVPPGQSKTVMVRTRGNFDHISVAAMLIPTNDGFFALNGAKGPSGHQSLTLFSPAYDAGSERNDELCASIPGPFFAECGGPGGGARVGDGEGYVHIHAGIHGIGNMNEAERDWRNPVAKISIRRVR
jgi:hypothetical protein